MMLKTVSLGGNLKEFFETTADLFTEVTGDVT